MKILICCEDENYVEVMKKMMMKYPFSKEIEFEICLSNEDVIMKSKNIKYDLVFIDCLIENQNIMEIGNDIKEANSDCMIFYMHTELGTAFVNMSFVIGAFQFLVKGEDKKMEKEFLRASQIYLKRNFTLSYLTDRMEKVQISPFDIIYIETSDSPTKVVTTEQVYQGCFEEDMLKVEEYLKEYNFLKIHNYYFVNMGYVMRMKPGEISMCNGEYLPVAIMKKYKINGVIRKFMN